MDFSAEVGGTIFQVEPRMEAGTAAALRAERFSLYLNAAGKAAGEQTGKGVDGHGQPDIRG